MHIPYRQDLFMNALLSVLAAHQSTTEVFSVVELLQNVQQLNSVAQQAVAKLDIPNCATASAQTT
ncbi:hypothetical protein [Photobacterium chitinilyticum]|uniref:Uncharacterized protein n=1 Tax=Photobacterium chitinilyticum TaxID=2485123 RepID=A0A3S3QQG4_9GAMM|nr:hypothetical protein [Photobacterium chitinilyticum]RWX53410.1 hypothetical protein EDI28_21540 [Photobacterium chitinilyticum]